MEPLQIHLFGGFLLQRGTVALPPIASRAGRSLFAYLVMHAERPQQRDHLAGIFWPDLPESRARRRLSHTLWQIQDVVNTDDISYLNATTDTLSFNRDAPHWLDVTAFEESFEPGPADSRHDDDQVARLRSCVDLYRGDFLAGFFDDWVMIEQDHLRRRYLTALRRLVDANKANAAYEDALSVARRLTHHDPLSEEAHQEVMRLSFLLGRTTEAIDQFERCRSVLEEELGAEPSAPTVELYEKIMTQRRVGVRPLREGERAVMLGRRTDAPFVGRELERGQMIDALERVLSGAGGVVLVEGEPGVGKTRTTLEAAEDARWRGFEVNWGSCRPGALRPFAPLIEVLESLSPLRIEQVSEQVSPVWLQEVARLAPVFVGAGDPAAPSPLRPAEESARMIEALVHTIVALGRIAPHLIIIDDVHWADRDTLAVLTQVGSRLVDSRVLFAVLYRSEEARGDAEVWDVLRELDRVAGVGRVILSPLSVFELDKMVRRILGTGRLDSTVAARLHRQTGGNVLFTLETLLSIRDQGLFESGVDPASVLDRHLQDRNAPVAPRVRWVIESRLSLLGESAALVYRLAAIAGDRVDIPFLQAASGLDKSTVLNAVDELLYRGLLRDEEVGRFQLTHDQIRQVVYDGMSQQSRSDLHLLVGATLSSGDPDNVEAIGYHFREGGDPAKAAPYLRRAGLKAIEMNAYASARSHLESARDCAVVSELAESTTYEILGLLEDVLGVLGDRDAQRGVIDHMEEMARFVPGGEADVARRRAWLLAQTGDLQGAEVSADRSVAIGRLDGDAAVLGSALVALGTIRRWSGRPLDAVPALSEAVEVATDERRRADAMTELASTFVELQRVEPALAHLEEASLMFTELGDLRGQAEVAGIEARLLHRHGEPTEAIARYETAIELCRQIGYRHGEGVNLTNLSNILKHSGSVAGALGGYDQAARIFSELGNRRGEAMVLANSASARHEFLGDDDRARTDATTAMTFFAAIGDKARRAQCQETIAGVETRRGRLREARELLKSGMADLTGSGNPVLEVQQLRSVALLEILDGDMAAAIEALDEAARVCSETELNDLAVELISIRSQATLGDGDHSTALQLAREAVSSLSPGVERPYLLHHRHALAASAAGVPDEARAAMILADRVLRQALAGLTDSEFERAVARVPEHRLIVAMAQSVSPRMVEVSLPAAGAPTGRPLEGDDRRLVVWTVEHPDDERVESEIARRRARVLRLMGEAQRGGAVPSVENLAEALDVSPSTIRRDLAFLRAQGHVIDTRGQRRAG